MQDNPHKQGIGFPGNKNVITTSSYKISVANTAYSDETVWILQEYGRGSINVTVWYLNSWGKILSGVFSGNLVWVKLEVESHW